MNPGALIGGTHPYPAYRPSNAEWLGDVPEHWEVRRLGETNASVVSGAWGEDPNGNNDTACVRVADFDRMRLRAKTNNLTLRCIKTADIAKRGLSRGDLLLEKSGGGDLQPVGAVVLYDSDIPAVCTNFVARVRAADGLVSKYLLALHFALYAMRINVRSIKQTTGIQNLDLAAYFNEPIPLPPLPEQRAIVRYLDYADRRIRRYVGAKRRLVALLQEERQAVVSRAVTRGLDPSVRLKPSGVEWLGDVPEHWEVRRLRAVVINVVEMTDVRPEGEIYLALENVESWTGRFTPAPESTGFASQVKRFHIGDILFGKLRPYLAKVSIPNQSGVCVGEFLVIRPSDDSEITPAYLQLFLLSKPVIDAIDSSTYGAKMPRADWHTIGDMLLPLPPLPEQRAIVEHLERETARIDAAIERARRQAALVEEYRTRLVADVVTGKIDVREASASLPGEAEDDEDEPMAEGMEGDAFADDGEEQSPEVAP